MNKYLSILELRTRQSLPKVLAVLAVMAAGELIWFKVMLGRSEEMSLSAAGKVFSYAYAAALVLICFLISGRREKGTNSVYQERLLRLPESRIYALGVVCDLMVFLIAWGVQVMVIVAAAKMYTSGAAYSSGPMGTAVQIINDSGLRSIIPVYDAAAWGSGIMCHIALALASSYMRLVHRNKALSILSPMIIIAAAYRFIITSEGTIIHMAGLLPAIAAFVLGLGTLIPAYERMDHAGKEEDDGK